MWSIIISEFGVTVVCSVKREGACAETYYQPELCSAPLRNPCARCPIMRLDNCRIDLLSRHLRSVQNHLIIPRLADSAAIVEACQSPRRTSRCSRIQAVVRDLRSLGDHLVAGREAGTDEERDDREGGREQEAPARRRRRVGKATGQWFPHGLRRIVVAS